MLSELKLIAFIDGACEPVNPGGTASYGVVGKSDGITIFTDSAIVGSGPGMSNNVAEYSSLIAFLAWYIQHADNSEAIVYSDSSLLINQMTGYWRAQRGAVPPILQTGLGDYLSEQFKGQNRVLMGAS